MNKEELAKKYPWITRAPNGVEYNWCDALADGWSIAFGDLFFQELDDALKKSFPEGIPEDFYILDIKEKWGKLRVYLSHEPQEVSDVLYKYEYISSFVCIECGAPYPFAQMTYGSWVSPFCEKCYIGNNKDKINKYHVAYMQTVLKDSLSVLNGPEDKIVVTTYSNEGSTQRQIDIKDTWEKIFNNFVSRTIM